MRLQHRINLLSADLNKDKVFPFTIDQIGTQINSTWFSYAWLFKTTWKALEHILAQFVMLTWCNIFVAGEKLGMEYSYAQSGVVLVEKEDDLSDMIDKGNEADSNGNADFEEGENYEDPLNQMVTVESDKTLQDKENVQICLKQ